MTPKIKLPQKPSQRDLVIASLVLAPDPRPDGRAEG
jgi:hypothetical protein